MSLIATPWTSPYDAAPEKWNPGSRLRFGCCLPSSGFAVLNCDREEPAFTRDKVAGLARLNKQAVVHCPLRHQIVRGMLLHGGSG